MSEYGRDRLRELLDVVLDQDNRALSDMAGDAHTSPFHFARQFSRGTGEPPVALRRRVMLERAAWRLRHGARAVDVAAGAGYDSAEGFSRAFARAFGHPPGSTTASSSHRLNAPNGIHFHPPVNLWVDSSPKEGTDMHLTSLLIHHDVDDTRALIDLAATLDDAEYRRDRMPGLTVLGWDGPEGSIATILEHLVWTREVWVAAIVGRDLPGRGGDSPTEVRDRHEAISPDWVGVVRDIEDRDAWGDRIIDALCEPPESFVLGSVIAHVVTFSAHRRQLARHLMREAGLKPDHGDPIDWLTHRNAATEE
ncbi:MAG: helix-turn-helix domain-containing protein [Aeromicrobium sp.]